MALVDIFEPVLTGGIRNTNFFNGRLLTAEDLTDFQTANVQQHQQLAHAIGDGVVYGFGVTLSSQPAATQVVLHVTQGLALNRNGKAVALPGDIELALVPSADAQNAAAGQFAVCQPPQTTVLTNPGFYILTALPASGLSTESAPKTDVLDPGVASTCGSRWAVEGAKFRTVQLTLGTNPDPSTLAGQVAQLATQLDPLLITLAGLSGAAADQLKAQIAPLMSKLRNSVAHMCLGTEKFANFPANPFGRTNGDSLFEEYGALDDLRDQGLLTDCDVPLALLYWTTAGLQFIDMWSVRRTVFPQAASDAWAPLAGRRRMAEGLATFLQFQKQLDELVQLSPTLAPSSAIHAADYFRFLPAAGLLPIADASFSGVITDTFFNGIVHREPEFFDGSLLHQVFTDAPKYAPVDLTLGEMVWLYKVWQSEKLIADAGSGRHYVVFTSPYVPYLATARFDVARWDYSNYASCDCSS